jgi:hypothetical protein
LKGVDRRMKRGLTKIDYEPHNYLASLSYCHTTPLSSWQKKNKNIVKYLF